MFYECDGAYEGGASVGVNSGMMIAHGTMDERLMIKTLSFNDICSQTT